MESKTEKEKLIAELLIVNEEIKKLDLTDEERKLEVMKMLHKYNETKDQAQLLLGALAEMNEISTGLLYKRLGIDIEK